MKFRETSIFWGSTISWLPDLPFLFCAIKMAHFKGVVEGLRLMRNVCKNLFVDRSSALFLCR